MKQILITALLEISDHDGYCSGDECEYTSRQIIHLCEIPEQYLNEEIGKIVDYEEDDWLKYLPDPELNTSESGYCELSEESESAGLSIHDYRYTIISIEIVDSI